MVHGVAARGGARARLPCAVRSPSRRTAATFPGRLIDTSALGNVSGGKGLATVVAERSGQPAAAEWKDGSLVCLSVCLFYRRQEGRCALRSAERLEARCAPAADMKQNLCTGGARSLPLPIPIAFLRTPPSLPSPTHPLTQPRSKLSDLTHTDSQVMRLCKENKPRAWTERRSSSNETKSSIVLTIKFKNSVYLVWLPPLKDAGTRLFENCWAQNDPFSQSLVGCV